MHSNVAPDVLPGGIMAERVENYGITHEVVGLGPCCRIIRITPETTDSATKQESELLKSLSWVKR